MTIEFWYAAALFMLAGSAYLTRLSKRRFVHLVGVGLLMGSIYTLANQPFPKLQTMLFASWMSGLIVGAAIIAVLYWRRRRRALIG